MDWISNCMPSLGTVDFVTPRGVLGNEIHIQGLHLPHNCWLCGYLSPMTPILFPLYAGEAEDHLERTTFHATLSHPLQGYLLLDRHKTWCTGIVGKLNIMGTADSGMGKYITPWWTLADEIHIQGLRLPQDCWVVLRPQPKDSWPLLCQGGRGSFITYHPPCPT